MWVGLYFSSKLRSPTGWLLQGGFKTLVGARPQIKSGAGFAREALREFVRRQAGTHKQPLHAGTLLSLPVLH